MATEEKVSINAEFAMAMWSSLNEADAPEAPILAAIIIGQGFEPILDPEETVDFYREFLLVNGFIEEIPDRMN